MVTHQFLELSFYVRVVVCLQYGVVAQLVRALALQARGRGFEYRQLHKGCRASRLADRDYSKCPRLWVCAP